MTWTSFRASFPIPASVLLMALVVAISRRAPGRSEDEILKMHINANSMKQEILKQVPLGMSLAGAKEVMVRNGFTCELRERATFIERVGDEDRDPVIHRQIDYLYCEKKLPSWKLCERQWQIAIVLKAGAVGEILVSTSLVCKGEIDDRSIQNEIERDLPLGSTLADVIEFLDGRQTSHSELRVAPISSDYPNERGIPLVYASIRSIRVISGITYGIYMTFRFDQQRRLADYRVQMMGD